jgi:hypothetical protein
MVERRMRVVWYSLIAGALTLGSMFCLNCEGPNSTLGKPAVPSGPSSGVNDSLYAFTSVATGPDGDRICYRFDWGDGDTSDWTAWVQSGQPGGASHSWQAGGAFTVRSQAKDSGGAVSVWSDGHQVNILTLSWAQIFGGTSDDGGNSVQQTSDGGYIITGYTKSSGAGGSDVWLIKTDASGNKTWDKTFGGAADDEGRSVEQTSDGGYIIAGYTKSYGAGSSDVWLIKIDSSGNKTWDKTFGGATDDEGHSVQQASDGGYIIAGFTHSYAAGNGDVWLIKTDASGTGVWRKTLGGTEPDEGTSVQRTSDGGYAITGYTKSYGAGSSDVWLIVVDSSGKGEGQIPIGGTDADEGASVQQTSDGSYIITGYTKSYGAGGSDAWLIEVDPSGRKIWDKTFGGTNDDGGASVRQTSDGGYVITGYTKSYGAGGADVWLIKTDGSGNEVWDMPFGGTNDDGGASVQQTSDGGYIITGYTKSYGAGSSDVWLIKTGANGN